MMVDYKFICKNTSIKNNIDLDVLTSINNVVFKEISLWVNKPDYLKIYLKHIGSWFYKKKKTKAKLEKILKALENDLNLTNISKEKLLSKIENYNFILSEYDKYTQERYEIKCKKYGKEAYEAYCLAKKQEKI